MNLDELINFIVESIENRCSKFRINTNYCNFNIEHDPRYLAIIIYNVVYYNQSYEFILNLEHGPITILFLKKNMDTLFVDLDRFIKLAKFKQRRQRRLKKL